ncbi:hypothetical protein [Aeromonas hydrophila]|uniref:hypothetical protein n=1 Tax=Aeromonas hydrophila TaxID=644 RepID=UPI002441B5A4|nr:hypothetical protein [Aeromonas hydrophila]
MIIAPIHIDTPVCTVESFSERTGLTQRTVENYVRAGRIPIMPKQGRAEKSADQSGALHPAGHESAGFGACSCPCASSQSVAQAEG